MAIIGLLLIAAAAAFGIEIAAMNNYSIDIDAFGQVYQSSASMVFVAGVVTGLAGVLGIMVLRDGLVRRRRLRLEAREADERRERHIAALEEEHAAHHRADVEADGNGHVSDPERERETVDLRDHDHVTSF